MLEAESGIPAATTSTAVLAALKNVSARTVFLASPYPSFVNEAEIAFLGAHGIEVTDVLNFGCTKSREVFRVPPETIVERILERREDISGNDALFITCTGLRSIDVVERLERELNLPVITSNSATLWLALRRLGVNTSEVKAGLLFRTPDPDR